MLGPSHSAPEVDPEENLALVAKFMSCSLVTRPVPSNPCFSELVADTGHSGPDRIRILSQLVAEERSECDLDISCPALALYHKGQSSIDHSSREEAENYAIALLSRSFIIGEVQSCNEDNRSADTEEQADTLQVPHRQDHNLDVFLHVNDVYQLPERLLRNIYSSFSVLVDSRLRAYATFLAQHGIALAKKSCADPAGINSIEQKLEILLEVGSKVTASSMSTTFEIDESAELTAEDDDDEECETLLRRSFSIPMRCNIAIDLVVPIRGRSTHSITMRLGIPGRIAGLFSNAGSECPSLCLDESHVHLDVQELLNQMMDQASYLVTTMVEMTNSAFILPDAMKNELKHKRGDSYLVMPPPPQRSRGGTSENNEKPFQCAGHNAEEETSRSVRLSEGGLNLLSQITAGLAIVSPETSARTMVSDYVPKFDLNESAEEDVSELSPDECANILDGVFGDTFDEAILTNPPSKKFKVQN